METATKNLENDHVHILGLIDVMQVILEEAEPNISHLDEIVYLVKNYADGFHHAKEEVVFFPMLEKRGFSSRSGPVAVMLNEHVEGRNYLNGIAEGIKLYRNNNQQAISIIRNNMREYIDLLRNHISKENNILFRMADRVLSEVDNKEVLSEFLSVTGTSETVNKEADFIDRITKLASYYGLHD